MTRARYLQSMTLETKTNKTSKMILKLNEGNDVKFKLSINGSVSNPAQTKVTTRFVVTENTTGISWMFPLERGEESGLFVASIPEMPSVFSEDLDYTGKVEVIVGNRYFNPTNVAISFERGVQVDAAPLLTETQEDISDHKAVESVIKPIEEEKKAPKKKPELPFDESVIQEVMFSSPKQQQASANPQPLATSRKPRDPGREKYKSKLKSLIAEAWKEIAD